MQRFDVLKKMRWFGWGQYFIDIFTLGGDEFYNKYWIMKPEDYPPRPDISHILEGMKKASKGCGKKKPKGK